VDGFDNCFWVESPISAFWRVTHPHISTTLTPSCQSKPDEQIRDYTYTYKLNSAQDRGAARLISAAKWALTKQETLFLNCATCASEQKVCARQPPGSAIVLSSRCATRTSAERRDTRRSFSPRANWVDFSLICRGLGGKTKRFPFARARRRCLCVQFRFICCAETAPRNQIWYLPMSRESAERNSFRCTVLERAAQTVAVKCSARGLVSDASLSLVHFFFD